MSSANEPLKRWCAVCAWPAESQCSGCAKAWYCSPAHQKEAWPKHKKLCKIYKKAREGEETPLSSYCGLCGDVKGPFRTTECCNRNICDDYGKYVPMSFSYNSCSRNHDRYTRCHYHLSNSHHPPQPADPYACTECHTTVDEPENETWYMTNRFNYQVDIERAVPPKYMPTRCAKCHSFMKLNDGVGGKISYGQEGYHCYNCLTPTDRASQGTNIYRLNRP